MLNEQLIDDMKNLLIPFDELNWKKFSEYPLPTKYVNILIVHEDYPNIVVPALMDRNISASTWSALCLSNNTPWIPLKDNEKLWWVEYEPETIFSRLKIPLPF